MNGRWTIGVMAVLVVAACFGAPPVEAAKESHAETATAAATTGAVNINTAGVKELMTLDGIGHKVAEKIVEYRTANGPFKKAEEIRKVQGIGGGLWEKNRDRIVVK
jgi:competence protein ComEA